MSSSSIRLTRDSLAQRGLSYAMIAVAAAVTRFGFATISHWFCRIQFSFCLAHSPVHHADLEADSIAGAPVVNICGADVATPVCAGLVPLRSLQTGSALRVTTGWRHLLMQGQPIGNGAGENNSAQGARRNQHGYEHQYLSDRVCGRRA